MGRVRGRFRGKLRALLVIGGVLVTVTAATPSCDAPPDAASQNPTDVIKADLFQRVNDERAARGIAPLAWDNNLMSYADNWSAWMKGGGFKHSDIGSLLGPYSFIGENIAAGSAGVPGGALHAAWMRSTWHRDNILNEGFTRIGIGVFCAPDGGIWLTQEFGREISAGLPPPGHTVPPENPVARPDQGRAFC